MDRKLSMWRLGSLGKWHLHARSPETSGGPSLRVTRPPSTGSAVCVASRLNKKIDILDRM